MARRRAESKRVVPPLFKFIPEVSPKLSAPMHLIDAARRLAAFETHPFEFVFSVPPRHGKSYLLLHFIVWALKRNPALNLAYVSYSAGQAKIMSRKAMTIATSAGLVLARKSMSEWATPEGGGVQWTGIGGQITGRGFDIILFDDPVKGRATAESAVQREGIWDFMQSDLISRLEPSGSMAVVQTRWHPDDPAGRLTRGDPSEDLDAWETINIPAIIGEGSDEERALWPERWPLEVLRSRRRKVGAYAWASLYQGQPRPRGGTVFGDPSVWKELPRVYEPGHGVDLAYTAKTSADWSVLVTFWKAKLDGVWKWYVVDVVRKQLRAPEFRAYLARVKRGPMRIYGASGPEKGAIDLFDVPRLQRVQAVGDKFTRAQPYAAAWNAGDVLVPADSDRYPWVDDFVTEHLNFTGVHDANDDQVDASAAGYDVLAEGEDIKVRKPRHAPNAPVPTRELGL